MAKSTWKKLNSKIIYDYRFFKLTEDEVIRPDGQKGKYTYFDSDGSVIIIPVNVNEEITLIKEFRYPSQKEYIGLPAGHVEADLSLEKCASKELLEETGLVPKKIEKIGEFNPLASTSNKNIHVFLAEGCPLQTNLDRNEGDEDILETITVSVEQIKEMIKTNKIQDGLALAAFAIYFSLTQP